MQLQAFEFEQRPIEVVTRDGAPWFVANEVYEVLGYSNPWDAIAKHVDDEDRKFVDRFDGPLANREGSDGRPLANRDTPAEGRQLTVINESGLYSLILRSRKPEAKRFKRWVTSEVLPAIRRTGGYGVSTIREHVAALAEEAAAADLADPANVPGRRAISGKSPRLDRLAEALGELGRTVCAVSARLWDVHEARRKLAAAEAEAAVPFIARVPPPPPAFIGSF